MHANIGGCWRLRTPRVFWYTLGGREPVKSPSPYVEVLGKWETLKKWRCVCRSVRWAPKGGWLDKSLSMKSVSVPSQFTETRGLINARRAAKLLLVYISGCFFELSFLPA